MRIATLSFNGGFLGGERSMHLYADAFRKKYCEANLTHEEAKKYDGDIIISFNGRPDLGNCPPKEFKGTKIVHLMDHPFRIEETLRKLYESEVTHLMVYSGVEKYDPLFRHFFAKWADTTIGVSFGYNNLRFKDTKEFHHRKKKVIALGAVNPVKDPQCLSDISAFTQFFSNEEYMHKWRAMLRLHASDLSAVMDSRLPTLPRTKDFGYNIVQEYNDYQMFTTCESLMRYPSVKTFEGMACGSVLVCSDHPCYKDLGLIDGVNCIMHEDFSLTSFKKKIEYWLGNPYGLEQIASNGQMFAKHVYSPESVADRLFDQISFKTVDKR